MGWVALYDPSGIVTDAATGEPIEGAEVTLFQVPAWTPGPGGAAAGECEADGGPWTQAAPTELGELVSPYGTDTDGGNPAVEPDVNPFITNDAGYYGWDVAIGCWYVEVSADGYQALTSPVVGVPPAVTDLDLTLNPLVVYEPPALVDDNATAVEDGAPIDIDVLANDAVIDPVSIAASEDVGGSASCTLAGCTFLVEPDFNGAAGFSYTVTDGTGGTATALVEIDVAPVNDAPIATDAVVVAAVGGAPVDLPWASSASDVDGDELALASVEILSGPGSLSIDGDASPLRTTDHLSGDPHNDCGLHGGGPLGGCGKCDR